MTASDPMGASTELLHFMIACVTDGGEVSKSDFEDARQIVMIDPTGKRFAPECVRICREPDAVWSYIKGQDPELPTYESRRQFLRAEFEPLLSALEQVEIAPLDDLVSKEVDRLGAASLERAWEKALERRVGRYHHCADDA